MPSKAFKVEVFESRTQRYNRIDYKALDQGKIVFSLFHKDNFDFSAQHYIITDHTHPEVPQFLSVIKADAMVSIAEDDMPRDWYEARKPPDYHERIRRWS